MAGPTRHSMTELHRSTDDATGDPITAGYLPAADGAGDVVWASPPAASGTAGGDLSGTYPNPTVAKINGVAVTGTPALGDVPTATSSTTATWQMPSGASSTRILLADGHATPFDFTDLLQMDDGSDFMWTD